jgi:hypothetical protein
LNNFGEGDIQGVAEMQNNFNHELLASCRNVDRSDGDFIKYGIQGCIFKMCQNFAYEVVGQRRRLKAIKKNCTSTIMSFYFLT